MRHFYTFITMLMLCIATNVSAQGTSRDNAIAVTPGTTYDLPGVEEFNTTTWFSISTETLGDNNLVTVSLSGERYGDVSCYSISDTYAIDTYIIGSNVGLDPVIKKLWDASKGTLLVAICQDGPGGQATFAISTAQQGETRENAIPATVGTTTISSTLDAVWYSYTAIDNRVVFLSSSCTLGNAVNAAGRNECFSSLFNSGIRMSEGHTIYFPVMSPNDGATLTIKLEDPKAGEYADTPIDITELAQFTIDIPADPTATKDGAGQSERYWLYNATKSGFLMWGSDDKKWAEGSWGCTVRDLTTGKTLNTPLTAEQAGMITYTISVEAGHSYLIAQTIGHDINARTANVYTLYTEPSLGDTRDNPFALSQDVKFDLGRVTANTKYYSFTAPKDGIYTATIHAGGQVRATTPQDGSWNIGRDYSITDMKMHIDTLITLAAGETLSLEVTLTSDIDIHVGGDPDIPNYYILITNNEGSAAPDDPIVDPEEPGKDDPAVDPEEPGEDDPEVDPDEPGKDDPEEPGEDDPEEPGEDDPEEPGEDDPEEPGEEVSIASIMHNRPLGVSIYALNGMRVTTPIAGQIYIVRTANKTVKVLWKN